MRKSWRSSNDEGTAATMLVAVVATLLLASNWATVPCAAQQCSTLANGTLAEVSSVGLTNLAEVGPTVAQRVKIWANPIVVSTVRLTLTSVASGTVEAQIRKDDGAVPGALVSALYVSWVETVPSAAFEYTFVFSNAPELAANTHYWILFTSPAAISAQWSTGQLLATTQSIDINTGAGTASAESVPATEQVPDSQWGTYPAGTLLLTLTVAGCEVDAAAPTPTASPAAMPSQSPVSSQQASSRTPQASASATPVAVAVVLTPITANVTSSFDSTQTSLNLTAPASSGGNNGTSGVTQPGVTVVSQFSEVRVGNRTLPPPAIQELTVSNDTSTNATTYTYTSQLENTTNVEQAFTFFDEKTSGNFAGLSFDIGASSIKWSIHLINTNSTAAAAAAGGLTLRYQLTGLAMPDAHKGTGGEVRASRGKVVVQRETPQANMTTYLVPLFVSSTTKSATTMTTAAQVELFDVALVDGTHFVSISHSIVRTSVDDDDEEASYVVELVLPEFNESLYYDPSIGLGVLLGRNDRGDGGSSSESNVGLIVGVAVAIPVAVVLVLLVIGAALAIGWRQKRNRSAGSINFGADEHHDDQL